jgi:large subunit ribosomal protein L10
MREEKISIVNDISKLIYDSHYIYVLNYKNINVKEFQQFKSNINENNLKCQVIKNSFFMKAISKKDLNKFLDFKLNDSNILIYGNNGDFVNTTKFLDSIISKHSKLSFKIGYSINSNQLFFEESIKKIAVLPSRDVLLSKCVNIMSMSYSKLVYLLKFKLMNVLIILKSFCNKKSI